MIGQAYKLPLRLLFILQWHYQALNRLHEHNCARLVFWQGLDSDDGVMHIVQVSPHEFMQAVMSSSNKRFTIEQQGDVLEFWAWFINTLHHHLAAGKRNRPSIISKCFQVRHLSCRCSLQGAPPSLLCLLRKHRAYAQKLQLQPRTDGQQAVHCRRPCQGMRLLLQGELEITTEAGSGKAQEPNAAGQMSDVVDRVPFLFLGLDLPAAPLYKDVMETNIIPQVIPLGKGACTWLN